MCYCAVYCRQDVLWWVLYKAEALLLGSWLRKAALKEVSESTPANWVVYTSPWLALGWFITLVCCCVDACFLGTNLTTSTTRTKHSMLKPVTLVAAVTAACYEIVWPAKRKSLLLLLLLLLHAKFLAQCMQHIHYEVVTCIAATP